eukprot:TRINITY_DN6583_c0_g1_i1.p1 TRINITY_DN6583_c0_g1~~TRINITY_DN6583_c0_g1_i1.p1  ORF type:complete len:244 (+),score=48.45 TRINITY_DN6583_c0_g1_i1:112-843(+)
MLQREGKKPLLSLILGQKRKLFVFFLLFSGLFIFFLILHLKWYYKCERSPEDGAIARKKILEGLEYAATFCEKNGIPYWVDFGTLLGAMRGGHFIPWDTDADLGYFHETEIEFARKIAQTNHSPFIFQRSWRKGQGFELVHGRYKIDLFSFKKSGDLRVRTVPEGWDWFPARFVEKFSQITFEGRNYSCPQDTENFIAHRFSDEWRTPINSYCELPESWRMWREVVAFVKDPTFFLPSGNDDD